MKKYLAIVLLGLSNLVNAQTIQTTPNQITSGTNHTWTGVTTGTLPSNYMPGGPQPLYDPSTNTISFSYGQATAAQTFAINQALQNAGAGITVQGYSYSWDIRNMNGDNRQNGIDTLTATVTTTTATGVVRRTDSWTYNTKIDWTNFNGIINYANPGPVSDFGNITVQFSGKDGGFWAGYFGPQVRDVNIGLRYSVDPCFNNPAYSPSCPNYNTVTTSGNLLSGITGPQAYAINSALALAGAGATIHGFDYGYDYYAAGRTCAVWDLFGFCITGFNYSSAGVNTQITNSDGTTLYSESNTHHGGDNGVSGTYSKQYRLSSSVPMSTLGTFSMNPWTSGDASITNMYSQAVYTADPCITNPLSSTTCSGYAAAYLTQQCTANPLYDSSCPGYAQALFTQQCNANQLSNPACTGYAAAYLTYQCNINSLYSTTCSGYASAINQCTVNPLSNTMCSNYQTATTECSLNPLYGSYCPGYTLATTECTSNPLLHTYCPLYQSATVSCSDNALSYSFCPGYTAAQTTCSTNPLSNALCVNYSTASASCSANTLYASYCPGYAFAYSCSQDGLYSNQCPNYAEAYAKKNILNIGSSPTATTTTVPSSSIIVLAQASDPVAQAAPIVSDPTVNSVITSKSTATTSETNPAAAVKLTTPTNTTAVQEITTKESAKTNTTNVEAPKDGVRPERPTTTREQLAEQRREAARKEAVQKGKDLANEMGRMADMQAQMEVQNVVIQAMGYTPGFDSYSRFILPDGQVYKPFTIYNNQRNVDSPAGRGLFGGNDVVHQQMVDSQYNLGK
jgi:hypothetical protein